MKLYPVSLNVLWFVNMIFPSYITLNLGWSRHLFLPFEDGKKVSYHANGISLK